MTTGTALDARYGRTVGRRRRRFVIGAIAAVGVVAVTVAWVIWAGLLSPTAELEVRDTGFELPDAEHLAISWELTVEPGATAACALQALDEQHAIVGWDIERIPASDDRTRSFERTLRTSAPAVTGLIYRCWLT